MALHWEDFDGCSILAGKELQDDCVAIRRGTNEASKTVWRCFDHDLQGSWPTVDLAKPAVVRALKERALALHTALCELADQKESASQ